jgi:beta-galactosidase GanA
LRKQGTATQLIVDGKPFLALAGELTNNSATSAEYMKAIWPKLIEAKLNTVLAGVAWNQIEPQEGKFDFTELDGVIRDARSHNLRLVLLWFASWKNGTSSYPPDWVKRDYERFPRAQVGEGRSIELLSPLSDAGRDADARAFAALMRHVKAVDGRQRSVIMIQVQNEVGISGDSRDRSPLANKAFAGPVPKELMDYLQQHKDTLIPEFRQVWEAAGFKTSGTWEEVFGKSPATDEIFMAWNYARYIGRVAEAGKAEYALPMYVNAALSRTSTIAEVAGTGRRGSFAVGGPMADLLDVWRAGGPKIDMLSPDAYSDRDFASWCEKYSRSGNPLFIPENMGGSDGAARVLYVFGRHDAIGWTVMGLEDARIPHPDHDLIASFDLVAQMAPLIAEHQGTGTMSAVLLRTPNDPPQKIQLGNYTLEVGFYRMPKMFGVPAPPDPPPPAMAILIATGPEEFFAAGSGVTIRVSPNTPGPPRAGFATVEEGVFVNGRWVPGRRLNGDDSDEGNFLMLDRSGCCWPPSARSIQRFTVYRYR